MSKYIDPKKIKLNSLTWIDGDGDILVPIVEVKKAIAQTPTEDVIEVVRCKDCVHLWGQMKNNAHYCHLKNGLNGLVTEEDFCSHGERKDKI